MDWTPWIVGPLAGALIGYLTNTVAVLMIFRPHGRIRLFGLELRGLIPKRQVELAKKIGAVVGTELVRHDDLVALFDELDLRPGVTEMIDQTLAKRLGELGALPMIGSLLTEERIERIRDGIVDSIIDRKSFFLDVIRDGFERGIDLPALVEKKVAAFSSERLERMVLDVARRELVAIQAWGAVLGGMIGLAQVALLKVLG
ncbi:MAG: DUF445 domain-containing protein [Planctomycetota bacterium]